EIVEGLSGSGARLPDRWEFRFRTASWRWPSNPSGPMADRSPRSAGGPTLADPVPAPLVEAAPAGTAAPAALPFAQRRLRVAIDARKLRDPESGVGSYIVNLVQALLRQEGAPGILLIRAG